MHGSFSTLKKTAYVSFLGGLCDLLWGYITLRRMEEELKWKQLFCERSRSSLMLSALRSKAQGHACTGSVLPHHPWPRFLTFSWGRCLILWQRWQTGHGRGSTERTRLHPDSDQWKPSLSIQTTLFQLTAALWLPPVSVLPPVSNWNFKQWSLQNKAVSSLDTPSCWFVTMWSLVWRIRLKLPRFYWFGGMKWLSKGGKKWR